MNDLPVTDDERKGAHVGDMFGGGPGLPGDARPVPGADGYHATLTGEIWSTRGEFPRRMKGRGTLYERHTVQTPSGVVHMLAHRMVLLTFIGPPPAGKPLALHSDGDSRNNSLANLRWGSQSENMLDAKNHGTMRSRALTDADVVEIRKSDESGEAIAARLGVNPTTVGRARRGDTWGHLPMDGSGPVQGRLLFDKASNAE